MIVYTLITGASAGIGRALALECAGRGMNLALVALPNTGLEQFAEEVTEKYSVRVRTMSIDLSSAHAPEEVKRWTQDQGISINMLINNAGRGFAGSFTESSYDFSNNLLRLNAGAVLGLTQLFIPELKKHKKAYILNLGSMASFHPVPYKSIYAASKSFVYSLSRALHEELKRDGITVSVLCPGPVITSEEVRLRIKTQGWIVERGAMWPEEVARIAINGLMGGKAVIVPGFQNKAYALIIKLVPRYIHQRMLERVFRRSAHLARQNEVVPPPQKQEEQTAMPV